MKTCPNCTSPVVDHPENGCVLAALIQCIRDRGSKTPKQVTKLHEKCDADALWNRVGPIVDMLEAGVFSAE